EYRIGVAIGDETLASGNTMQLAPTVNVLRHPAWGRAQETYGEDPYQSGRLGAAFTVGVQEFIPTCVKHYLGNDVEGGRESFDARMDEQTLREIYGYPFEMIIRDAGVACVMAAYNEINGTKSAVNTELLTTILRQEWGFQGLVVTDWWAMPGNRTDSAADALDAIEAGLDMELPWSLNYLHLEQLIEQGDISESDLDRSARRVLEQKYRFNVASIDGQWGLRAPTTRFDGNAIGGNDAHIELAYEAALKGAVLLKNEGVLPIAAGANVAVLGLDVSFAGSQQNGVPGGTVNFATGVITGDSGSSRVVHDSARQISIAQGLGMAGANVTTGTTVNEAADADFVVVVVGRTPDDEGEEYTGAVEPSGNFLLDGGDANGPQNTLIQQAIALNKPMAVVMIGGTVIDLPWIDPNDATANAHVATVMAWYPGMVGGRAVGDLLMGVANFSGKLPMTWPRSWSDEPTFTDGAGVDVPYDHGYRHFDRNGITPLFAFGHGLSYTTFSYDSLQLGCTDITRGGVLPVVVNVSNPGTVAGEEVIFVFTSFTGATRASPNPAPVKELKGFYRVQLEPNEAKQVTILLRMSDLKYWDTAADSWAVDSGTLNIQVGPSAANLPLSASVPVL
ncbi:MAG TPA: glycoside hydrolase family 3 N-terminal domain-containing protein, partial [Polyangiaceae bacterium]|nr:glycoside hydrolase family 3 N-terminal domain-containing protein [Polyangiaceae bacterium]